jgi:hypothetical protein
VQEGLHDSVVDVAERRVVMRKKTSKEKLGTESAPPDTSLKRVTIDTASPTLLRLNELHHHSRIQLFLLFFYITIYTTAHPSKDSPCKYLYYSASLSAPTMPRQRLSSYLNTIHTRFHPSQTEKHTIEACDIESTQHSLTKYL